jgi:hypothetical protein
MRIKTPSFLSLLTAIVIVTQVSCSRFRSSSDAEAAKLAAANRAAVDQILERYEQAVGGKEAIEKVKSYKMRGTFELSNSRATGTLEAWGKEPSKTLTVIEFPRIGTLKKGFDGETRWVQTPSGTVTDTGPQEIAEMERDAAVYSASAIRNQFESMRMEYNAWLSGREVNVIEGIPPKGPSERLFFDVENGLLVRWDMARKQLPRGTVFVKVHLDDYREVDGVKVPFNIKFAIESFNFTVKLDELQHNVQIDDVMFRKP